MKIMHFQEKTFDMGKKFRQKKLNFRNKHKKEYSLP